MNKLEILKEIKIGHRIAEDEANELAAYFFETEQWQSLEDDEIDIVYGSKGTGKSALYTLLSRKEDDFFDKQILLAPAENPMGAPAFKEIVSNPPPSEQELNNIWKIYLLTVAASQLREYAIKNDYATKLIEVLESAGLLPRHYSLTTLLKSARDYIFSLAGRKPAATEWELGIDPISGMPLLKRRSEFGEDQKENLSRLPADELVEIADLALKSAGISLWLLLDRLDVSFAESREFERVALRGLFRVYSDFKAYSNIKIKIFVRDDIWQRITDGGFAEASHIVKYTTTSWDRGGILNLVVRRLLNNQTLCDYLKVKKTEVLSSAEEQDKMIKRILPEKVAAGKNPETFDWILSRVSDGRKLFAPREVIHMLDCMRRGQIKKLEQGDNGLENEELFDRQVIRTALEEVSKTRYEKTLIAEYPEFKIYTEALRKQKAEQNITSLSSLWSTTEAKAKEIAEGLISIGFFELKGDKQEPSYWVPFLYRDALELVQGKA